MPIPILPSLRRPAVAALVVVLTTFPLAAADVVSGKVTRIVDGDTFDIGATRIRVWGLDAPERGAPGSSQATAQLGRLIASKKVTCAVKDIDRYGRTVGQCLVGGRDVTAAMIASGTATEYCRYSGGAYGTCRAR